MLAWVWVRAFSLSEWGLRSLSAVAGTFVVPLLYAATRALGLRQAALAVAAVAATSPLLTWYAQEARPYSLLVLLGAASILLFARARTQPTKGRLAAWGVCTALAILTHYFAALLAAGECVLLFRTVGGRRALLVAVGCLAGLTAALVPLVLHQRSSGRAESIAATSLVDRARVLPNRFLLGEQGGPLGNYGRVHYLLYPLAILVAFALWQAWRRSGRETRPGLKTALALFIATGVGPLVLALIGYDYVVERNLILAWLPLSIIVGFALTAGGVRHVAAALTAAFALLSAAIPIAIDATPTLQRDDWRGVAHALCQQHHERALVVTPLYALPALQFYLPDVQPLPTQTIRAHEIDVIAMRPSGPAAGLPRVITGTNIMRVASKTFVVTRFALPRAVGVNHQLLNGLRLPTQGLGLGPALLLKESSAPSNLHWGSRCGPIRYT